MLAFQTVLVLVFGGVGLGLTAEALIVGRKARTEAALAAAHPDAPWLWKPEWTAGRIADSGRRALGYLVGFAVFWNLVSAPLCWHVLPVEVVGRGNRLALIALVFPLIGLLLIAWAVVAALRYRKFGRSVFQMASVPGVVGGQLAGVIRTSAKIRPEDGFRVTLSCIHRVSTGTGRRRSTSEKAVWQDERLVAHELLDGDPTQSAIPVLFDIPYESRTTDEGNSDDQTTWRLDAAAKVPGLDYSATFDVPVFKTPESDPNFVADDRAIAAYVAPADPERDLREAGVIRTISPEGDGQRFTFPMARTAGSATGLSAIGLIFTGVTVVLLHWGVFFFAFVFALLDLVILWGAVDLWFYRSVVDISRRGLAVRGGCLGLGRRRWIEASEIAKLQTSENMQSGSKVYFDVVAVRRDGQRIKLGKRLPGARLTAAVIGQMEQALRG